MTPWRFTWSLLVAVAVTSRAFAGSCGEAVVTIVGDNRSAEASTSLSVSGIRIPSADGCDVGGTGLAVAYATTVTCAGPGSSKCGRIEGLAPGLWIHRVSTLVPGSPVQIQAQRSMVVAGGASNVVEWTVFGRTFVVDDDTGARLMLRLQEATAYTASMGFPALVRFDRELFPDASAPQTLALQTTPTCALDTCQPDGRQTAYCLEGSDITVDALDDDGQPGGVVLAIDACDNSVLRIYGSSNVLRGLVFQGSTDPSPAVPVDVVAIAGVTARRNRLEQCTVVGPTLGDGVSVQDDAGQPDGDPAPENVIAASEVHGAEDKGIKVAFGGVARIERSCVHDNANGGLQVTLGGSATALENVIQHNLGGPAQNGLSVGVPETVADPNALTTRGNVVRFNGARGISVVNAAQALLVADVVTDNYQAGLRVETTLPAVAPSATVRGGTFACNYAPGICTGGGMQGCRSNGDCAPQTCSPVSGAGAIKGVGATLAACADAGCVSPVVDLGAGGLDSGRNAFTLNPNPDATSPTGINVNSAITSASAIPAAGNEWEHCDVPESDPADPKKCYMSQVSSFDVRVAAGTTALALGTPTGPRHGPNPVVTAISPARPAAGELVRVYGGQFNAIDGAACQPPGVPADPCSVANAAVVSANAPDVARGNHVTVTIGGAAHAADVHQVTPTMLVFEMPVDCDAPGALTVARGSDVGLPVQLCDPAGCAGRRVGALCDDGDLCTTGETCQASGTCGGATPLSCSSPCLTGACDPAGGCEVRAASAACEDGDACTVGDHCSGDDDTCVPGAPRSCTEACFTGACDPGTGCILRDAGVACTDGDACTEDEHCTGASGACVGSPLVCDDGIACTIDGCDVATGCTHDAEPDGSPCADSDPCRGPSSCVAGVCDPGPPVSCDDGDACTEDACAAVAGCTRIARTGLAGVTCHVAQLRTLVDGLPADARALAKLLGARLDCADRRIASADAAAKPRPRAKHARKARRCVARLLARVVNARELPVVVRNDLRHEGEAARAALDAYFAL
jgi:hypothetical protein